MSRRPLQVSRSVSTQPIEKPKGFFVIGMKMLTGKS